MKGNKWSWGFLLLGLVWLGWATPVAAAPAGGSLKCTYKLPYESYQLTEETLTLTVTANYTGSGADRNLQFDPKQFTDSSTSGNGIGKYFETVTNAGNYSNRLIADNFANSKGEWTCPDISYQISKPGDGTWILLISNGYEGLPGKASVDKAEIVQATKTEEEDAKEVGNHTLVCPYVSNGRNIVLTVNTETKVGQFKVDEQQVNKITNYTDDFCPHKENILYCPHLSSGGGNYSQDLVLFNQTSCYEYALTNGLNADQYSATYHADRGSTTTPNADGEETPISGGNGATGTVVWPSMGQDVALDCEEIMGDALDVIQEVFDWIKIIVPILLILFGGLDFSKAVVMNDKDILQKAVSNFVKRCIAALAIFFLPTLINLLLSMPGISDNIAGTFCSLS